ncbi:hypothetical protein ACIQVL_03730 [Streptomyces sp. NPDC090499]|uniref:hypothetical protein n=1 Tax=Streptomyces sp. NPDC090499 TaxID=3365965 RepID=UPI00380687A5
MNDTAATIFTAIAGGLFALAVAYISYRAGRRQTTDQATIEHGQWLRGQRQQAYLALQEAWDTAIDDLQKLQDSWEGRVHAYAQDPELEDPSALAIRRYDASWRAVWKEFERVELLGPQRVDVCLREMEHAFRAMGEVISNQSLNSVSFPYWDEWHPALRQANTARSNFHAAATRTLRQPPSPEGERGGPGEQPPPQAPLSRTTNT